LLKLAHVQRLLPLEQLLSGVEANRPATPERKLTLAPEPRKPEASTPPRSFVSPFAADSARKGTPRSEFSVEGNAPPSRPASAATNSAPVVMGSAAPAVAAQPPPVTNHEPPKDDVEHVRAAVHSALSKAGQSSLSPMPDRGAWKVAGSPLNIPIAA